MTEVHFDREQADSKLQELGAAIIRGRNYLKYDWDSLSLVFDFDGGESLFGYVYWASDGWAPATPGGFEALDAALELRKATAVTGEAGWKKCLVQISRASGKIDIQFDHDGSRWQVDVTDPEGFARSLRPY